MSARWVSILMGCRVWAIRPRRHEWILGRGSARIVGACRWIWRSDRARARSWRAIACPRQLEGLRGLKPLTVLKALEQLEKDETAAIIKVLEVLEVLEEELQERTDGQKSAGVAGTPTRPSTSRSSSATRSPTPPTTPSWEATKVKHGEFVFVDIGSQNVPHCSMSSTGSRSRSRS